MVSFLVGAGAMAFGVIDPRSELYLVAIVAVRVYVSLPLLVLGAITASGSSISGMIVAPETTEDGKVLARDVRTVSELTDNLRTANEDLDEARDQIREQASEATRINNKLRETLNLLLSSEEKFRCIFERANDGFFVMDVEKLLIEQANPRLASLTGYQADELVGRTLDHLCGEELGNLSAARIRELTASGSLPPITIRRKDGTELRVELSFSLVDVGGNPVLLGIVRDVSERPDLLEELEEKNQNLEDGEIELREANRKLSEDAEKMRKMNERLRELTAVKDNFISSVSHEFRTPLTSIRSFSEILLEYNDAEEEVKREFVTIINKESERLTRLINDVLDLARIEAGEMKFELVEVDLNLLVREVVRSLAPLAQGSDISIEARLPADLPPVMADRDKLHQVIQNLLSNALKFTHAETIVSIGATLNDEGMVEVCIEDRGPGIPKDELQRIFEKFRQVGDTLTEKPAGTGLGLAICREIITLHGGRVWVRSTTGRGSTFYFTVKAAASAVRPRKKKKSIADRVRETMEKAQAGEEATPLDLQFEPRPEPEPAPVPEPPPEPKPAPPPESASPPKPETPPPPPNPDFVTVQPIEEKKPRVTTREIGTELPPLNLNEESDGSERRNLPPMLDRG
jgi:PAS domain S-box-containing protein